MDVFTPVFDRFRFYADGTESGSVALANENTNISVNLTGGDAIVLLRMRVQNTTATAGLSTDDYVIEWSKNGGAYGNGAEISTNTTFTQLVHGNATTNRLTAGTGSFQAGRQIESTGTLDFLHNASTYVEHVIGFKIIQANVNDGDTLDFRVTLNFGTPGMTNSVTPRITVRKFTVDQQHFRFRNDDGSETTATWKLALDTNYSDNVFDTNVRLRIGLRNTGSTSVLVPMLNLHYRKNGGSWVPSGTAASDARITDSSNLTNGGATTQQITSGTFTAGQTLDTSNALASSFTLPAGNDAEFEFCVQFRDVDLATDDTVEFALGSFDSTFSPTFQPPTLTVIPKFTALSSSATGTIATTLGKTAASVTTTVANPVTGTVSATLNLVTASLSGFLPITGTASIAFGPEEFNLDAVVFDGTNDYLTRGAAWTSAADSSQLLVSFWIRKTSVPGAFQNLIKSTNSFIIIRLETTGRISFSLNDPTLTTNCNYATTTNVCDGNWHHVIAAFDTNFASTSKIRKIYIDGVLETLSTDSNSASAMTIDFTDTNWAIGGNTNGANKLDGEMAEIYFAPGQFLDLTVAANREKFRSSVGRAKYVGTDGSLPTGTAPYLYLHLDDAETANNFASNTGTGGGMTVNGALSTASSEPPVQTTNPLTISISAASVVFITSTVAATLQLPVVSISETTANPVVGFIPKIVAYNPNDKASVVTLSNSNKTVTTNGAGNVYGSVRTNMARAGKIYFEVAVTTRGNATEDSHIAVANAGASVSTWLGQSNSVAYYANGAVYANGSNQVTISSYTNGDVIMCAYDSNTGQIWFGKNGTWGGTGNPGAGTGQQYISTSLGPRVFAGQTVYDLTHSGTIRTKSADFSHSIPSGFSALEDTNYGINLLNVAASATASESFIGTVSATLNLITVSATAIETMSGSIATTIPMLTLSLTALAANPISGDIATTIPMLIISISALNVDPVMGTIAAALKLVTVSISALERMLGTIAATPNLITLNAQAQERFIGTVSATLTIVSVSATASERFIASVAATLPMITTASATTVLNPVTATVSATLSQIVLALSATETLSGSISTTLALVVPAITASENFLATASTTLAGPTVNAQAIERFIGNVNATIALAVLSIQAQERFVASISTTLQNVAADLDAIETFITAIATTLPKVSVSLSAAENFIGNISTTLSIAVNVNTIETFIASGDVTLFVPTIDAQAITRNIAVGSIELGKVAVAIDAYITPAGIGTITLTNVPVVSAQAIVTYIGNVATTLKGPAITASLLVQIFRDEDMARIAGHYKPETNISTTLTINTRIGGFKARNIG